MYNQTRGLEIISTSEQNEYYCFTSMGKMLDKYALSFGDEVKYSYSQMDENLSTQKLSYSYMETYKGEIEIEKI
jgi:hypothetical protein